MKKSLAFLLSLLIILSLLTSCSNKKNTYELSEHISPEALSLTGIKLDVIPQSLSAYKNIVFILCD